MALFLLLGAAACEAPFSEEAHSDGPAVGAVRLIVDPGTVGTPDPDGFVISGPGFSVPIPSNGGVEFTPGFPEGLPVLLRFERLGEWCSVNPPVRTIVIRGADTLDARFIFSCSILRRAVRIRAIATDTTADSVQVSVAIPDGPFVLFTGHALPALVRVGDHPINVGLPARCHRSPLDSPVLQVPYYPADTIPLDIHVVCEDTTTAAPPPRP